MYKRFLIFSAISLFSFSLFAQTMIDSNKVDPDFHIYLLMGQSNMSGRGVVSGEYATEGDPRVFMLDKNKNWVPAHNPLHFDKTIAGVGPGLAFAIIMAKENPKVRIGLVPCAVGGTSIRAWVPGGYDSATKTHPYDDALVRIKTAMKSGVVTGMLWHQGESDSKEETAALYPTQFKALAERIRAMTEKPTLPVVAGELGRYKDQFKFINTALNNMTSSLPDFAVASSEGLVDKGDNTHFDSPSAEKMGKRMAEKMIMLQKQ
ncbi:MAG: sialate O-acetylesterase [Chitinophagaceae bacterium]